VAQAAFHDEGADDPRAFAREMVDIAASTTRAHPHANRLGAAAKGSPAVADAVHFFTLLHAERPSAATLAAATGAGPWASRFAQFFEAERGWLARAAVTAGPARRFELSRHEHIVRAQREAMLTLARSERAGCALGAVAALAADWPAVRQALCQGEVARDIDPAIVDAVAAAAGSPAARRAIGFGVAQMLAVHRALWDLLEAREANSLP
jgi:hypothetical protein